jgi:hypothetical protein
MTGTSLQAFRCPGVKEGVCGVRFFLPLIFFLICFLMPPYTDTHHVWFHSDLNWKCTKNLSGKEQNECDVLEALGDYKCDVGMSLENVWIRRCTVTYNVGKLERSFTSNLSVGLPTNPKGTIKESSKHRKTQKY